MKTYRVEMTAKGYLSTTIFLFKEHREEVKRLAEAHRIRAEAAEHIFQIYLRYDNKHITQTHNTNTGIQTKTLATIESLKTRLKAMEERDSKQAEYGSCQQSREDVASHSPCFE